MNQVPSIISNEANVDIEVRVGDTGGECTDIGKSSNSEFH
jgi:hypothetical protein